MWNERGYLETEDSQSGRHSHGYNILFCEGHVELIKRKALTNAVATARFFNIDHEPHLEFKTSIPAKRGVN
jgi:prepilin-type processing-associated H-X9-DG protein